MFPTSDYHSVVPLMFCDTSNSNQIPMNWQNTSNTMNHQDNRYSSHDGYEQQHFSPALSMNDSDTDFQMWTPQNQKQQQQNFNHWMDPNVPRDYSGQQRSCTIRSNLDTDSSLINEKEQEMPYFSENQNGQIVEANQDENFQDSKLSSPSKRVFENMDQATSTSTNDQPDEEYAEVPPLGFYFPLIIRFSDREPAHIENLTHEQLISLSQQAVHNVKLLEQDMRKLKKENERLVEELEAKAKKFGQNNVSTVSASTEVHLTDVLSPDGIVKYMEGCGLVFENNREWQDRGVPTEIRKTITKCEPERQQVQILELTASQLWFQSQKVKRKFSICACDYCCSDEENVNPVAEKELIVNEEKTGENTQAVTGSVEQQSEGDTPAELCDSAKKELLELEYNFNDAQEKIVNPVVDKELIANEETTRENTQASTERGTQQNEGEIYSDLRDSAEKVVKLPEFYPERMESLMYSFIGPDSLQNASQEETHESNDILNEASTKTSSFSGVVSLDRERLSETASDEEMDQEVDEKTNEEKESHILNNSDYVYDKEETTKVISSLEAVVGGEKEQIGDVMDTKAKKETQTANAGQKSATKQQKKKAKNKNKNKNLKKKQEPSRNESKEDDKPLEMAIKENEDFLIMKSMITQYFAFVGVVNFTYFGFVKKRESLHPFYDKILHFWQDDLAHVFDPEEDEVEGAVSVHLDQRIKRYSTQKTAEAKKLGEFYSYIRHMLKESLFTRHMVLKDMCFVLGKADVEKDEEYAQLYYEMVRDFYIWQPQVFDLRAANIEDLSFSDLEEKEKLFFVEVINAEAKTMSRTIFESKIFVKAKNKDAKLKIAYNIAISKLGKPKEWEAELTKELLPTRKDCWANLEIATKDKSKYVSFYNTLLEVDSYILHTDMFMLNTMTALLAKEGKSQWILETTFMEAWFGFKCRPILYVGSDMELRRVAI
ncbi:hypothetical protein L3Y34_012649 [Caenorhabditis briggsae]|uniref:Uncharacterized protein n=1 Tax=Caenorhabditis briggsae TaxID=6238 RepID=A0AAE8ZPT1_CAEBR|nr:hypothetical protein L3Y34_012649 [Caenorhabditis briggsae]